MTIVEGALTFQPFWQSTVQYSPPPGTSSSGSTDVVIIGGGITGLCAARALARRKIPVTVLEARTIGWGASSRNGGMVLTGLKLGPSTLIRRYGLDAARRMFSMSVEAVDTVEKLVQSAAIDCDFERCGHVALASKPGHYRDFEATARLLAKEFSHRVRPIPRSQLRDEIGSDLYHGGLLDSASASVNPARYVAGLARAASDAGARIHELTAVTGLERRAQRWRVTTSLGTIDAKAVLIATSGYTSRLTDALRRRIVPIGSYVIATEPLSVALANEVSPRGRMFYDSRHFLHYFRLTPDRRMLFGGRARFVPETGSTVSDSATVLHDSMLQTYPQLRDTRVEYAWGGTLDFAYDTMPHTGHLDGLHYALGYAGHGVGLASYLGTRVGALLGRKNVEPFPFSDVPFPGPPLGLDWGRPGLLSLIAAWYRLLDWIR